MACNMQLSLDVVAFVSISLPDRAIWAWDLLICNNIMLIVQTFAKRVAENPFDCCVVSFLVFVA